MLWIGKREEVEQSEDCQHQQDEIVRTPPGLAKGHGDCHKIDVPATCEEE